MAHCHCVTTIVNVLNHGAFAVRGRKFRVNAWGFCDYEKYIMPQGIQELYFFLWDNIKAMRNCCIP